MQNLKIFTDPGVATLTFLRTFSGVLPLFSMSTYTREQLTPLLRTGKPILWATGPAPAIALSRYNSWAKTKRESAQLQIYCLPTGELSYQIENELFSTMLFNDITRLKLPTYNETRRFRRRYSRSLLLL